MTLWASLKAGLLCGLCFKSCPDFPQWWTMAWKHKPNKSLPPLNWFWSECFIIATKRRLAHLSTLCQISEKIKGRESDCAFHFRSTVPSLPAKLVNSWCQGSRERWGRGWDPNSPFKVMCSITCFLQLELTSQRLHHLPKGPPSMKNQACRHMGLWIMLKIQT